MTWNSVLVAAFLCTFLLCLPQESTGNPRKVEERADAITFGRALRDEFRIDPRITPLNHAGYGAQPVAVQQTLHAWQNRIDSNVDLWMRRDGRIEVDKVRVEVAKMMGSDEDDIVLIPNTASGANAVLRSIAWQPGDKILYFNTAFRSIISLINYTVEQSNGTVSALEMTLAFPMSTETWVWQFEAFVNQHHRPEEGSRIRIALMDHITSTPSVINPIERFIPFLKERGILSLIDGAHAIGQIPIDIRSLSPDYYITNAYKWLYASKPTAILYVAKEHQSSLHPAVISFNYDRTGAKFQDEFYWTGTADYSPYLTIPAAIGYRKSLGGEEHIRNYTHNLAREAGLFMSRAFGTRVLQQEDQFASTIDVQLPLLNPDDPNLENNFWNPTFMDRFNLCVMIYKHAGQWWVRPSMQVYIDMEDIMRAAQVISQVCTELNE